MTNTATTAPTIPLTRTETTLLQAAAADGGRLTLPDTLKPATRDRLLGRFLRDGLASAPDGTGAPHRLTTAGYRAIGLTPPRRPRAGKGAVAAARADATDAPVRVAAVPPSKKALVATLLARAEGATLAELTAATGWLPHTARAALSRIRSGGQSVTRTPRPDSAMAYRIPASATSAAAA